MPPRDRSPGGAVSRYARTPGCREMAAPRPAAGWPPRRRGAEAHARSRRANGPPPPVSRPPGRPRRACGTAAGRPRPDPATPPRGEPRPGVEGPCRRATRCSAGWPSASRWPCAGSLVARRALLVRPGCCRGPGGPIAPRRPAVLSGERSLAMPRAHLPMRSCSDSGPRAPPAATSGPRTGRRAGPPRRPPASPSEPASRLPRHPIGPPRRRAHDRIPVSKPVGKTRPP